jgi:hypothetical protein
MFYGLATFQDINKLLVGRKPQNLASQLIQACTVEVGELSKRRDGLSEQERNPRGLSQ